MKRRISLKLSLCAICFMISIGFSVPFAIRPPSFKVLVILSKAKDHKNMMACEGPLLEKLGAENNFVVKVTEDTSLINDTNLAKYQVFVQLQLAPFDISYAQQDALQKFILQGNGWVGIHAAGLTGKRFVRPERKYWAWFEEFLGGIEYSPHPAFQKGTVIIEDHLHPVTRNLPASFQISDEWYEFDKSPRPNVRVLATADESSYHQNKPMGDHPIIWTNERYKRMIYIGIGHDSSLCNDNHYTTLVRDAILWAASPVKIK
jgi:type 1 glutamine amidotransferase